MEKTGQSKEEFTIYLENLVCIVQEDFLVLDEKFHIYDASPSFFKTFRLTADTARGKSIFAINDKAWDTPEIHALLKEQLQEESMVYDYIVHQKLATSQERVFHINGCDFGYVETIGRTYILTFRDTTEQFKERQRLYEDLDDLQNKNDALDAFAHSVAHDLKNPVSSMIGLASLIKRYYDKMSDANIIDHIDDIITSGYQIQEIIDSTLMLAMLDRSDKVEIVPLDMHTIIERVEQSLNHRIRETKATIKYPDEWHSALGQPSWVELVWMNYLSNALKYGGRPPIITLGSEHSGNGVVKYWIEDNGNGVASENHDLLFESFTRFQSKNGSEYIEGHGLGLALVKKIVNKLNGHVYVESDIGKGSRFSFTLPATS